MKNITLLAFLTFTGILLAQDDADKKVQAGISISTSLNLNKTATKKMEVNGIGSAFSIGLIANINITKSIGFATGLDIDFETNKIKPVSNSYYNYTDTKITLNKDLSETHTLYQWTERKQKPVYITLPTMLSFKTKYFGDFRYTAKFGLRTSFLLSNKINDKGFNIDGNVIGGTPVSAENNTMKAARDMNIIRSFAGLALGTEWNFSGSNSLCFELGYYYGFIQIYSENKLANTTLFNDTSTGARDYYSNNMTQNQLQLKISVLF